MTVKTAIRWGCTLAATLTLSGCGLIAEESPQEVEYRALSAESYAGLKAGLTCSGVFVSGRPLEQVINRELGGLHPPAYATPAPEVDTTARTVRVPPSASARERLAVFRPGLGCTILPAGQPALRKTVSYVPDPLRSAGDEWPRADAPSGLAMVVNAAFQANSYGSDVETIGAVVIHRGQLIAEQYADGFDPQTPIRMWSAAKMLVNAAVGVLVQDGALDIDEQVHISAWQGDGDPRQSITYRHLLEMSSGLNPAGSGLYGVYQNGEAVADAAPNAELIASPGSQWSYANRDTMLIVLALRTLLGDEAFSAMPHERLLRPLGMSRTVPELSIDGTYVLSSQVYSTPRDMAKLGQLYLQDGVWKDNRLLPEGWVSASSSQASARPTGFGALLSYGLRGFLGYGSQIWIYRKGWPAFGFNGYSAIGHRGQYITVVPEHDLVVVRTGLEPEDGSSQWRQDLFVDQIIDALRE